MAPKSLILLKSIHHQNTAKIATAIDEVLQADIMTPEAASPQVLADYQLIGFGSGIYFGRLHSALRQWLKSVKPCSKRQAAFIFSTAGLPSLHRLWHRPFRKQLEKKGFEILGEYSCAGYDTVGPLAFIGGLNRKHPDNDDLIRAVEFAHELLAAVNRTDNKTSEMASVFPGR